MMKSIIQQIKGLGYKNDPVNDIIISSNKKGYKILNEKEELLIELRELQKEIDLIDKEILKFDRSLKHLESDYIFRNSIEEEEIQTNLDENLKVKEVKRIEFFLDDGKVESFLMRKNFEYRTKSFENIRGLHSRYSEEVPWKRIPIISGFKINKNVGASLILGMFGLTSRAYYNELSTIKDEGNLIKVEIPVSEPNNLMGNKYLKRQLSLLEMRNDNFLFIVDKRLGNSVEFFILNLINWDPIWYKNYNLSQLIKIIIDYDNCLKNENLKSIREVWIQDGRKWRVLGIPTAGTRLFLSGINKVLMLWFDKILDKKTYHGFMYGRGVTTYWREIFKNNYLDSDYILEMDISANFNNVDKKTLFEGLIKNYSLPDWVIKLIYAHISVKISSPDIKDIPSISGILERFLNKSFNYNRRNLPQGLSISPMLSIINCHLWIESLKSELNLSPEFRILCYADDISMYLTKDDFGKLGRYNFVNKINLSESSQRYGIILDSEKSQVVKSPLKVFKILKLLGLVYDFKKKTLSSSTRGRNFNPITKRKGKEPLNLKFDYEQDLEFINRYEDSLKDLKFFLDHKNLNIETIFSHEILEKYFNTIISYLYKGDINVIQNFSIKNCKKGSLLSKLFRKENILSKEFIKDYEINTFSISQYFVLSLIQILSRKRLINNLIIMSEQKNFGSKKLQNQIEKLSLLIKTKSLKDSYENVEILFDDDIGPRYYKAKELDSDSIKWIKLQLKNKIDFETKI